MYITAVVAHIVLIPALVLCADCDTANTRLFPSTARAYIVHPAKFCWSLRVVVTARLVPCRVLSPALAIPYSAEIRGSNKGRALSRLPNYRRAGDPLIVRSLALSAL
ncbi:unnamed protein product [Peniophora sp. CBMAI 1063]|nr:unnamed protein product [Peniophora sp. CBMAI 1063]